MSLLIHDINYIIHKSLKGNKKYQEILIKKLHPLIFRNIYRYYRPDDNIVDDLVQEGYIVILECLKNYDENYNVHFLGFVKNTMYYFYKNYFRDNSAERNILSLNQLITDSGDLTLQNLNLINQHDTLDEIIELEEINCLYSSLNKLSNKEQRILNMYYYDLIKAADISKVLKIPYRTVTSAKYTAIVKLKKHMCIDGGEKNE